MAAQVTDTLEVWIGGVGTGLGWRLSAEADGDGIVSGIDAAKSAAEKFAREWIAAQAAALGDGPALHVGTVLRIIRHGREGNIRGLEAYAGLLADKLEADGEIESAKRVRRTAAGDYGSTLRLMEGGAPLGDSWVSVEERLPEHHVEVLVASIYGQSFQAVGMWHGAADEIFEDDPGWYIWNRPLTYKPDFVTHWRPLPPLPVAEVKE